MDDAKHDRHLARARQLRKSMSLPEVLLWKYLRPSVNTSCKIRRQVPFEDRYILDFYCPLAKICFEIDGKSGHLGSHEHDRVRDEFLASKGVRTIRIAASRVLREPFAVSEFIIKICTGEFDADAIEPYA